MDHNLQTERLNLRPVTPLDLTALAAHWTDPQVRRYLFDGAELPAAELAEAVEDSTRSFAEAGWGLWLVFAGDELIGTAGLRQLDELGPEILYSLVPSVWGKGYASEAARAVLDYALVTLGLPVVLAEVDEGNKASAAIIARLGMTPDETVPGELGPMIRYRMARSTHRARR